MKRKITNAVRSVKLAIHNVTRPAEVAPTSVGEILADFDKKIIQLKAVNERENVKVAANTTRIRELTRQNEASILEGKRAEAVAAKLSTLVS